MMPLEFNGDFTIEQIFIDYKKEIYKNVLKSIKENYRKLEKNKINVVEIHIHTNTGGSYTKKIDKYKIDLSRNKFIVTLNSCIEFFEGLEEYELCQECLNIINEIQNNKKNKLTA